MSDGYNTTIVLTCGCQQRLNVDHDRDWKVGYWTSCSRHSAIVDYDSRTGEPNYDRDVCTVEVIPDEGRLSPDG